MPAYVIAISDIKDPERFKEYSKLAGLAVAKYGGKFLIRGGVAAVLEGTAPGTRFVVVEHPDAEAAKRFYDTPEYQEARSKRIGAADFSMFVVDGA